MILYLEHMTTVDYQAWQRSTSVDVGCVLPLLLVHKVCYPRREIVGYVSLMTSCSWLSLRTLYVLYAHASCRAAGRIAIAKRISPSADYVDTLLQICRKKIASGTHVSIASFLEKQLVVRKFKPYILPHLCPAGRSLTYCTRVDDKARPRSRWTRGRPKGKVPSHNCCVPSSCPNGSICLHATSKSSQQPACLVAHKCRAKAYVCVVLLGGRVTCT